MELVESGSMSGIFRAYPYRGIYGFGGELDTYFGWKLMECHKIFVKLKLKRSISMVEARRGAKSETCKSQNYDMGGMKQKLRKQFLPTD